MPPKRNPKLWIQSAIRKSRKGALRRQLGLPTEGYIPVTLLKVIKYADIGKTIHNPTTKGKRWIKVTRLLKRRSVMALTLKRMKK